MAVTAAGSGTQTATVTTEHTLLDIATAGVFTLHVDTSDMVAGDALELRVYQIILTGGTRRVAYFGGRFGEADANDGILVSEPIANELTDSGSLRFTLKQTTGVSCDFPWKVLAY